MYTGRRHAALRRVALRARECSLISEWHLDTRILRLRDQASRKGMFIPLILEDGSRPEPRPGRSGYNATVAAGQRHESGAMLAYDCGRSARNAAELRLLIRRLQSVCVPQFTVLDSYAMGTCVPSVSPSHDVIHPPCAARRGYNEQT